MASIGQWRLVHELRGLDTILRSSSQVALLLLHPGKPGGQVGFLRDGEWIKKNQKPSAKTTCQEIRAVPSSMMLNLTSELLTWIMHSV